MDDQRTPGRLVIGPILRRVVDRRASIWVQTSHPATVEIRSTHPAHDACGTARTFSAFGCNLALVIVSGLPEVGATPYQVVIDGHVEWPPPGYGYPPPVIHTRAAGDPVRLVFGSCRKATPNSTRGPLGRRFPPDALDAYAVRLARSVGAGAVEWPDSLVLLGDQVYADETSPPTRRWLRRRSRPAQAPSTQVLSFEEYARLYRESWSDPDIRWLLSTVPSVMIFDDHEVIDDWNSSATWRRDMVRQPWWIKRIGAGLSSYWAFQHLGNLHPDELAADPVYAAVTGLDATGPADATELLREFGLRADERRDEYRWSYALQVGPVRIVVLDNRAGRQLEPGPASMLPARDWRWLEEVMQTPGYEHLVIGSSLPWLLPHGVHHAEAAITHWAESGDGLARATAEKIRRTIDLEHWPAVGRSFDELSGLIARLGTAASGDGRTPPRTVTVLSGDVHHSYAARPNLGPQVRSAVHQLTCSPVHNKVPLPMRPLFSIAWRRSGARLGRMLSRAAGLAKPAITWVKLAGPYFGNAVGTLHLEGAVATALIEGTRRDGRLVEVFRTILTDERAAGGPPHSAPRLRQPSRRRVAAG